MNSALKIVATAIIPFMAACSKKEDASWDVPVQTPVPVVAPKEVASSGAYKSIDDCAKTQVDNALELADKKMSDLSADEYKEELSAAAKACKGAYDAALAQHQTARPRFTDKADCERTFGQGQCESSNNVRSNGNTTTVIREHESSFSPLFTYFMMSQMLHNNNNSSNYDAGYRAGAAANRTRFVPQSAPVQSAPVYQTPAKTYVSPTGKVFDSVTVKKADTGAFVIPQAPVAPFPKGATTFKTEIYTPPKAALVTPRAVPAPPSARDTGAKPGTNIYVPPTSRGSTSTDKANIAPPPAAPAARQAFTPAPPPPKAAPSPVAAPSPAPAPRATPSPSPAPAPSYRAPAPAPSYRAPAPSPSFGGGRSSGGFSGGGGRS